MRQPRDRKILRNQNEDFFFVHRKHFIFFQSFCSVLNHWFIEYRIIETKGKTSLVNYPSILLYTSICSCVLCLVTQSYSTLWDPMDCSLPGSSEHGDSPGKNTGKGCPALLQGCPALLQGIFPTQGSNPGLPHCRGILYHMSHLGNPRILE